ncbi:MAG: hypothetical protein ACW98D_12025 [Promethearchaeota archaeon]|jgi:hypothetical protein
MKEFRVSKLITLRLTEGNTILYVNNKEFKQCKILLLNIPREDQTVHEFNSIDEATEKLDNVTNQEKKGIFDPEAEFWGHCSNLQAWVENKYDTTLLHRALAFPLLHVLSKEGDLLAKQRFKEEIARRYKYGNYTVQAYLFEEGYLSYLTKAEILDGILSPEDASFMEKVIRSKKYSPIPCFDLIRDIERNNRYFISIENGKIWELELELDDRLNHIPREIENLNNLNRLNLLIGDFSDNIFKEKFNARSVKNLVIDCQIEGIIIPDLLFYFPNLENLRIVGYSGAPIVQLVQSFKKLMNLKLISLEYVTLTRLPETLIYLKNLTDLSIRNTDLKNLPLSLIEGLESLDWLYLAGNRELLIPEKKVKELKKKITHFNYFK